MTTNQTPLVDLMAELRKAWNENDRLKASIKHCERCGGDWADTGLQGDCQCLTITTQADELDRLRAELDASETELRIVRTSQAESNAEVERLRAELAEAALFRSAVSRALYDWEENDCSNYETLDAIWNAHMAYLAALAKGE